MVAMPLMGCWCSLLLPDAEVVTTKGKCPALMLTGQLVAHVIAGAQLDGDPAVNIATQAHNHVLRKRRLALQSS